jgi:sulfate permease, SulP family
VTVTLLAFTSLFHYLPSAVLAAIVMVAVYGLIDVKEAVHLFHSEEGGRLDAGADLRSPRCSSASSRASCSAWRSRCWSSSGAARTRTWRARLAAARERVFRNVKRYPEVELYPGVADPARGRVALLRQHGVPGELAASAAVERPTCAPSCSTSPA